MRQSVPLRATGASGKAKPRSWSERRDRTYDLTGRRGVLLAQAASRQRGRELGRPSEPGYVQPDGSYGPRQSALMAKEWREALWPFGRPTARLGGPAICPTLPNARAFERTCGGYVQPDGSYGPRQSALMAKEWREAEPWPREIGCRAPAAYRKDPDESTSPTQR
ncbi:unnamed protein product [Durusdinium trenchii]|uniref:Uncharacterized protein n=1 Tax=Durusdinium trenchii TaxID=1381693 RepID=A0ABP0R633_9DINO